MSGAENLSRLDQQAGHIVVLRGRADKHIEVGHDASQQLLWSSICAGLQRLLQPEFAEFFLDMIFGFNQPVSEDDQPIAR